MWAYLGLLLVPLAVAISRQRARSVALAISFLALLVAIGFRRQVGCDWNAYLYMFVRAGSSDSLLEALSYGTVGFMFLNWLVAKSGLGIAVVNVLCAFMLLSGVFAFCRVQPRQWLGLLISTPILIFLAGFGATRQGAAAGLFLLCLYLHQTAKGRGLVVPIMLLAASFHVSALPMLFLILAMRVEWPVSARWIIVLGATGALAVCVAALATGVGERYPVALGAWFRVIPTLLALLCLPLIWSRAQLTAPQRTMLTWLASFAVFSLGLGFFSTLVMDRLNYYAVPLQIAVFCRFPDLGKSHFQRFALECAAASPFIVLLVGWLALTDQRRCAVPYRSYLTAPKRLMGRGASTDYRLYYEPEIWRARVPSPTPRVTKPSNGSSSR